jgi:hypothetical protein
MARLKGSTCLSIPPRDRLDVGGDGRQAERCSGVCSRRGGRGRAEEKTAQDALSCSTASAPCRARSLVMTSPFSLSTLVTTAISSTRTPSDVLSRDAIGALTLLV